LYEEEGRKWVRITLLRLEGQALGSRYRDDHKVGMREKKKKRERPVAGNLL